MVEIYTDGACSSSDKTGGWAAIFKDTIFNTMPVVPYFHLAYYPDPTRNLTAFYGCAENATNNLMELSAMCCAMYVAANYIEEPVTIYTDSAYIANCFKDKWYLRWEQNGWRTSKKTPVEHQDLWQSILSAYRIAEKRIVVQHIKAHSTNIYNNYADNYAVAARMQLREHLATQE